MRRLLPVLVAAAAILAVAIIYLFVQSGETAHTGLPPEAARPAR